MLRVKQMRRGVGRHGWAVELVRNRAFGWEGFRAISDEKLASGRRFCQLRALSRSRAPTLTATAILLHIGHAASLLR